MATANTCNIVTLSIGTRMRSRQPPTRKIQIGKRLIYFIGCIAEYKTRRPKFKQRELLKVKSCLWKIEFGINTQIKLTVSLCPIPMIRQAAATFRSLLGFSTTEQRKFQALSTMTWER